MRRVPVFGGIRLLAGDGDYIVEPRDEVGSRVGPSFALPPLAVSSVMWMSALAGTFYERNGRCLTLTLMLNLTERSWAQPVIPTQRCSSEGSAWSYRAEDFADLPDGVVIAGSFASTTASDIAGMYALVPEFDGLHVIAGVGADAKTLMGVVTLSGEPLVIEASRIVEDDWVKTLAVHASRLRPD